MAVWCDGTSISLPTWLYVKWDRKKKKIILLMVTWVRLVKLENKRNIY